MRVRATFFIAFAVAVFLSATSIAQNADRAALNAQIDQTNFLVNDNCSATLVDVKGGYLLTANHCIRAQFKDVEKEEVDSDGTVKKRKVRIAEPGKVTQQSYLGAHVVQTTSYTFKIAQTDRELDLALLKVQATLPNTMAAKIGCTDPQRGQHVYAVGNSYAVLYASLTEGIVSSVQRDYPTILIDNQGDNALVQHSAPIVGGNSGGALYNDAYDLIGVNVRSGATGFSFAAPLADVKRVLRREGLSALWDHCEQGK